MRDEVGTTDAIKPPRGIAGAVFGLSCALIGVLAICYAAEYLFHRYPKLDSIWRSVKVETPASTRLVLVWGLWIWLAVAAGTVGSLALAIRHPGRARIIVFNVAMGLASVSLVCLVNHGAWSPLVNLLLDFVDPHHGVPRRH
jgi:hypothetical protein